MRTRCVASCGLLALEGRDDLDKEKYREADKYPAVFGQRVSICISSVWLKGLDLKHTAAFLSSPSENNNSIINNNNNIITIICF